MLKMEYSLFDIKREKEFIETRYKALENRKDTELGVVRNMNYDIAVGWPNKASQNSYNRKYMRIMYTLYVIMGF